MNWLSFTVVGALVTTIGTLVGLFLKDVLLARSFENWKARQSLAEISRKYREPIALSALELCNRLTFICGEYPPDFLDSKLLSYTPADAALNSAADPYFRRYRLLSTVYRLCSFLGWVELYRQDTTFLEVDDGSGERRVDRAIYAVRADMADGQLNTAEDWESWHDILIFREEQRAIGEAMIVAGAPRSVMGYGQFSDLFGCDPITSQGRWLYKAGRFLFDPKAEMDFRRVRMQRLIVHLVDLVHVLSPARVREEHRAARTRYMKVAAEDTPRE